MKNFICLTLFILPLLGFTQTNDLPLMSISGGLNITNLRSDTIETESAYYPFIGINMYPQVRERLQIKAGLRYSMRGYNVNQAYPRYQNHYLDLVLIPQYIFPSGISVEAGVQFSPVFKSGAKILNPLSGSGTTTQKTTGFQKEIHFITGFQLPLHEKFEAGLHYSIPTKLSDFSLFQISLNYFFNKEVDETVKDPYAK